MSGYKPDILTAERSETTTTRLLAEFKQARAERRLQAEAVGSMVGGMVC